MTNGFDLGHDLDIWILKVICDLDHLVTKVRFKDLPDSDWGDFRCRRAVDSSSYDTWIVSDVHYPLQGVVIYCHEMVLSTRILWELLLVMGCSRGLLKYPC